MCTHHALEVTHSRADSSQSPCLLKYDDFEDNESPLMDYDIPLKFPHRHMPSSLLYLVSELLADRHSKMPLYTQLGASHVESNSLLALYFPSLSLSLFHSAIQAHLTALTLLTQPIKQKRSSPNSLKDESVIKYLHDDWLVTKRTGLQEFGLSDKTSPPLHESISALDLYSEENPRARVDFYHWMRRFFLFRLLLWMATAIHAYSY